MLLLNSMPWWCWAHERYIVPPAPTVLAERQNIIQCQIHLLEVLEDNGCVVYCVVVVSLKMSDKIGKWLIWCVSARHRTWPKPRSRLAAMVWTMFQTNWQWQNNENWNKIRYSYLQVLILRSYPWLSTDTFFLYLNSHGLRNVWVFSRCLLYFAVRRISETCCHSSL